MYSLLICLAALIVGYLIYGKFIEKVYGIKPARPTPAIAKADGVDFVAMPAWKVYMIQFLNIAGTGPIFGAIMGAKFGPSSYIWIVFGCIFAGAVHDFLCGMFSIRHDGTGLPEIVGYYLGKGARKAMLVISLILLLLVGVVFVYSPALILGDVVGFMGTDEKSVMMWVAIIFLYYLLATMLPIDKLIGKIYPLFAFSLLFMAVGLCVCLLVKWPSIPEIWDGLHNMNEQAGMTKQPIFPYLFLTITCGAISGFHSTQSPLMARCVTNEKLGRPIFYGAMITEGIVALVWAAVSSYFFFDGGMAEVGATSGQAPEVVTSVAKSWLGTIGGILAILGVVAAPITSGDTVFRSARLMIADFFHIDQKPYAKRFLITVPLFAAASLLLWFNISDEDGFNVIWRYFGCTNQVLAAMTLWAAVGYFTREKKGLSFLLVLIPAVFINSVIVTYICIDPIGFNMPDYLLPWIAAVTAITSLAAYFTVRLTRNKRKSAD